ncbi:hypothetical protein N656DRAFT_510299 [Canariomyces notabilis]|uniref:Uncharacterized protein n=1 Tax=Canariomyces notabilis TaxID=2074819 RepID=A0AAN6T7C3_9PEZI|nr:hypothetical protein N656DRAFT_510299 [Canariomyces arenarius]
MSYGREFHFPLPLLVGYLSEFSCPGHIQVRRLKHAVFFPCCCLSVCLSVCRHFLVQSVGVVGIRCFTAHSTFGNLALPCKGGGLGIVVGWDASISLHAFLRSRSMYMVFGCMDSFLFFSFLLVH